MKRIFSSLGMALLFTSAALAQQAGIEARLSPLPIWPADEVIPPELSKRYAFLDPSAGQLVLSYPENIDQPNFMEKPGARLVERFAINNRVKATISLEVQRRGALFHYQYRIANAREALQPVRHFSVVTPISHGTDALAAPAAWNGRTQPDAATTDPMIFKSVSTVSLSWLSAGANIDAGQALGGFQVTSALKPGFTQAYVRGGPPLKLRDGLPDAVVEQAKVMLSGGHDSQVVITLGPRYTAQAPSLEIAAGFHLGISRLVRAGQLDGTSPAVQEMLYVLKQHLDAAARHSPAIPLAQWIGPPLVFNETPRTDLESQILGAMRLSMN